MIPFKTTEKQFPLLISIFANMARSGDINARLIVDAFLLAEKDQGIFDLMYLWNNTADSFERDQIMEDLQKSVNDYKLCFNK